MKKTYLAPVTEKVKIASQRILAGSPNATINSSATMEADDFASRGSSSIFEDDYEDDEF